MSSCEACGADLRPGARFCPACGAPSDGEVRRRVGADAARALRDRRALHAIALLFVGTMVALALPALLMDPLAHDRHAHWVFYGSIVPVAAVGIWRLGPGSLRSSLGVGCRPAWLLLGVALGLAGYGVSHLYVERVNAALGLGDGEWELSRWHALLTMALLPAVFEEALDRGVLWEASSRVLSPLRTLLLTSLLFAVMHGLHGTYLAYPHRFVGGLLIGWLRLRTGSLLPGMVAHLVHNATWVLLVT